MQEARNIPTSSASSFASLLSSLTSLPKSPEPWDLSDLADDVATISYEQALQTHTHMKPSTFAASTPTNTHRAADSAPRTTIVTLRLSQAESAQLHQRAAEAGLTVSAYLRSCVFEAEALRTQVREALAQFRSAASQDTKVTSAPAQPPSPTWRTRFFPHWSRERYRAPILD